MKPKKKRSFIILISCTFLVIAVLFSYTPWFSSSNTNETFIYYPEDTQLSFIDYNSNLFISKLKDNNEYYLDWEFNSKTNKPVFLRQDLSLLFENGILVDYERVREEKTDTITEKISFHGKDSGKHEVITYHYAEIHYEESDIKSKQAMSTDILYVMDSPLSPLIDFKTPQTDNEKESMELLDSIIDQQLEYVWEGIMEEFNINKKDYLQIPFNNLPDYNNTPLAMFSQDETTEIIGKLWEGIYKYYILGINTFSDSSYNSIGNSLPLILVHQDGKHLIVIYETADQTKQQLLQLIPSN